MSNWFNKGSGTVLKFGGRVLTAIVPTYTIRLRFSDSSYNPTTDTGITWPTGMVWTKDTQTVGNEWEAVYASNNWSDLFGNYSWDSKNIDVDILSADFAGVTNASRTFSNSAIKSVANITNFRGVTNANGTFMGTGITSIPLFDTSSVTNASAMFASCRSLTSLPLFDTHNVINFSGFCNDEMFYQMSLTSIPLLDTSSATNVDGMFEGCQLVESGALALYTQMSTQTNVPSIHSYCFSMCGNRTTTGAAELAQIPSSWGGTGA